MIQAFSFTDKPIRVQSGDNGEVLFIAKDVCDILDINNSRQALSYLDDDEKGVISNDTPGGVQQLAVVNESGLYSLVLRSRKPEAKAFKKWITSEVLPTIRKHGMYATSNKIEEILSDPDAAIQILTRLKEERAARLEAENLAQQTSKQLEITETVVREQAPKVKYHDTVLMSNSLIAIDTIAHDLGLTAVRLNRWLSDCKIQYKENGCFVLYGRYRDLGLAQHKVFSFIRSDGSMGTNQHLYWTEKGRKFIHTLYNKAQSDAAKN